jgi:hypothetical protein
MRGSDGREQGYGMAFPTEDDTCSVTLRDGEPIYERIC